MNDWQSEVKASSGQGDLLSAACFLVVASEVARLNFELEMTELERVRRQNCRWCDDDQEDDEF